MAEPTETQDISAMSFEDALAELEEIVTALESGSGKLEESISAYERGARLKAHCEARLKAAQQRVEKITLGADGTVSAEPMDDA